MRFFISIILSIGILGAPAETSKEIQKREVPENIGAENVEIKVRGLGDLVCTISIPKFSPVSNVKAEIEAKKGIPIMDQRLVHGTNRLKNKKLYLIVEKTPVFAYIRFNYQNERCEVMIHDPVFSLLNPMSLEEALFHSREIREEFKENPHQTIECSLEQFFDLFPESSKCPFCPISWDTHDYYLPFCDYKAFSELKGALKAFVLYENMAHKDMTCTEQRLLAILVIKLGGELRHTSYCGNGLSKVANPYAHRCRAQKVTQDNPEIQEMIERFVNKTGEFARSADGGIEHVRPAILEYISKSTKPGSVGTLVSVASPHPAIGV